MKRWHFRAPRPGVFPKCHFINHRMDLAISWSRQIISTQNKSLRLHHRTHLSRVAPSERLIRNAKEMFWHWHVTYVWTLWPGEDPGRGGGWLWWMSVIRMTQWRSDAAQTRHMEYLHQPRLERDWSHTMSIIIRLLLSIERLTFWNLKFNCILVMLTRFNTLLEFAMIRGGKKFRDYCIHVYMWEV